MQATRKPVGFMVPISCEIYKNIYINKGLVQYCCLFIKAIYLLFKQLHLASSPRGAIKIRFVAHG